MRIVKAVTRIKESEYQSLTGYNRYKSENRNGYEAIMIQMRVIEETQDESIYSE